MAVRAGKLTRGERNAAWIEAHCMVPEGKGIGQPVRLRPFQRDILRGIYDTPTRRAVISFGRKNGKTALSAFLLLLHLCGPEARQNSQLYSAAQSRDQAAILFDLAMKVVRQSPDLLAVIQVRDTRKELLCPELGTRYRALSAEAATAYGLSPAFVVHDELGQVEDETSPLYEAIETAAGAQDEPLSIVISTQAPDDSHLLSRLIEDAKGDPSGQQKLFLYTAPLDMDPFSDDAIKAANPAWGDFLNADEVRRQAESARRLGGASESSYRNLILNQRVSASPGLFALPAWEEAGSDYRLQDFAGSPCWAALDLSSTTDTTALVLVFRRDKRWWSWPVFWLPAEGLSDKAKHDHVPYDRWAAEGWLRTCPGRAIDQLSVLRQCAEITAPFKLQALAFDRWGMNFVLPQIEREGIKLPLIEFGQGFQSMSPAIASLETAMLNGEIHHNRSPVLRWHIANAKAVTDDAGNRKLTKKRSAGRIDGAVALVMALHSAMTDHKELPAPRIRTL